MRCARQKSKAEISYREERETAKYVGILCRFRLRVKMCKLEPQRNQQLTRTAMIRFVFLTHHLTERHPVNVFVDLAADAGKLVLYEEIL